MEIQIPHSLTTLFKSTWMSSSAAATSGTSAGGSCSNRRILDAARARRSLLRSTGAAAVLGAGAVSSTGRLYAAYAEGRDDHSTAGHAAQRWRLQRARGAQHGTVAAA